MPGTDAMVSTVRSADGTAIGFERSGDGPPVILVDHALCYRGFGPLGPLAKLLAADLTVYTYDRRGRGDSGDAASYAVQREIEDLAALIAEAGGSAFLYGASSGALLALQAAAHGLAIPKLALFEPPLGTDDDRSTTPDLIAELTDLLAADRRGEVVERFQTAIGMPAEVVAEIRPFRPALEAIAHTIIYDLLIVEATSLEHAASVTAPTLVVASESSPDRLATWAKVAAEALPNGTHRSLPGQWHEVSAEGLAPVLTELFTG